MQWCRAWVLTRRELRRRYQIDEPASHAAQLCVSHRSRSSWCRCCVRHRDFARPSRGCLAPCTDVPRLGGGIVPRAYWLPNYNQRKGSVYERRNRGRSRSPRRHRAALAATRTSGTIPHNRPSPPVLVFIYAHLGASPAETEGALDHEQRRQDTICQYHARAGWIAHHG